MAHESAGGHQPGGGPRRFPPILRSLRARSAALLSFLQSDAGMEHANNEAQERKRSAGPVRAKQAGRLAGPPTQGAAGSAGQNPVARDRGGYSKREGRQ